MNKLIGIIFWLIVAAFLIRWVLSPFIVEAAPTYTFTRGLIPELTNTYELGTTSKVWKGIYTNLLGIGTTSPSNALEVNGNSYLAGALTVTGTVSADTLSANNWTSPAGYTQLNGDLNVNGGLYVDVGPFWVKGADAYAIFDTKSVADTNKTYAFPNWNGEFVISSSTSLYVSTTTGKVGIGTTSPSNALEVNGSGWFNSNLTATNVTATGTLTVSGKSTLDNASTTALTVTGATYLATAGGNVGIGTLTPGFPLEIYKASANENFQLGLRNSTAKTWSSTIRDGIVFYGRFTGQSSDWAVANINYGYTNTYANKGSTLSFGIINTIGNWTNAITIKGNAANGDVGIGTITPGAGYATTYGTVLDVTSASQWTGIGVHNTSTNGGAFFNQLNNNSKELLFGTYSSSNVGTKFGVAQANNAFIYTYPDNALSIGTHGAANLTLGTNSVGNVTIQNGGNVGIGTTTPATTLDVAGTMRAKVAASTTVACTLDLRGATIYSVLDDHIYWCRVAGWTTTP